MMTSKLWLETSKPLLSLCILRLCGNNFYLWILWGIKLLVAYLLHFELLLVFNGSGLITTTCSLTSTCKTHCWLCLVSYCTYYPPTQPAIDGRLLPLSCFQERSKMTQRRAHRQCRHRNTCTGRWMEEGRIQQTKAFSCSPPSRPSSSAGLHLNSWGY